MKMKPRKRYIRKGEKENTENESKDGRERNGAKE